MSVLTRKAYYTMIYEYQRRRSLLWEKHGGRTKEYAIAASPLTKKIRTWKKAIRRIDERSEKLRVVRKKAFQFFRFDVMKMNGSLVQNKDYNMAVNSFIKYCMEELNISGRVVGKYLKRKSFILIAEKKRMFTNRFKFEPEMRDLYHKFKSYVNE